MCLMNENCECLRREHTKHSFFKCSGLNSLSAIDITDRLTGKTIVLITNINVQISSIISYQLIPTGFLFTLVSLVCFFFKFYIPSLVCELSNTKHNLKTAMEIDMI